MTDTTDDSGQDFYAVLGVEYRATQDEIEKAYHDLARKLHPDVTGEHPELTARYMAINEAYQVLSKKENRVEYDISIGIDQLPEGKEEKPEPRTISRNDRPASDMHRLDAKLRHVIRQAETLCRKSNFWEATRMLERYLKTHPENAQLRKTLATAALGRKRYHEAADHMKIVCKVEYHTPEHFVLLGRIYIQAGQLMLAEKALHEALGWNAEHEGALRMIREIMDIRDTKKPPLQRVFRKVAKAFSRKE